MKIMYMITTLGHGRGGHFYDLKVIASAFAKEKDVFIVNVGLNPSPIIDSIDVDVYNIYFNGINMLSTLQRINQIISKENPTHIHCFDTSSFSLGRVFSFFKKIPLAMSKCGGSNPRNYYPISDNLVVMSDENFNYFKTNILFSNTNIHYIPQRSSYIKTDNEVVVELRSIADNAKVFLRITRITSHYESSLIQSINLANDLKEKGLSVKLFIVGVVQSTSLYKKMQVLAKNNTDIFFFTDDRYTVNASRLIDVADFVIGTGRGIMEAASKNKVLLTPMANARYPVIIDEYNFESLFKTNFSPRNRVKGYSDNANFNKIEHILQDEEMYCNRVNFIERIYKEKFDIQTAVPYYLNFYKTMKISSETYFVNFSRNILSTIKNIYAVKRKGVND